MHHRHLLDLWLRSLLKESTPPTQSFELSLTDCKYTPPLFMLHLPVLLFSRHISRLTHRFHRIPSRTQTRVPLHICFPPLHSSISCLHLIHIHTRLPILHPHQTQTRIRTRTRHRKRLPPRHSPRHIRQTRCYSPTLLARRRDRIPI